MSTLNGRTAASNELRISRFLQSKEFQVDDNLWRSHVSFTLDLLEERGFLCKGRQIAINVDFTSSTDAFLIVTKFIRFTFILIELFF